MEWWGYMHTNGKPQAKRWFGDAMDLSEAQDSPFTKAVYGPFEAEGREDALQIVQLKFEESALCDKELEASLEGLGKFLGELPE